MWRISNVATIRNVKVEHVLVINVSNWMMDKHATNISNARVEHVLNNWRIRSMSPSVDLRRLMG